MCQPHLDGIPADVVAAAIGAITLDGEPGHRTFRVSNDHRDDGSSLDSLARAIERVPPLRYFDHAAWYAELRSQLETLDEPTHRRGPLPVIERWSAPAIPGELVRLDTMRFREKLRALLGLDDVPSLDAAYLEHMAGSAL